MHLFYAQKIVHNQAILSPEETKHCTKILRKQVGDTLFLIDGKGGFFEGELVKIGKKDCSVRLFRTVENPNQWDFHLHIAIAPTKNISRFEFFLEKATELGVNSITPLLCKRSERQVIRSDRLEKVIISAAKQSVKPLFPVLNPLTQLTNFLTEWANASTQKFIASYTGRPPKLLQELYAKQTDVLILIGPEGDFHPREIELAEKNGFQLASLGKSRLRTETAGIIAGHTIHLLNATL